MNKHLQNALRELEEAEALGAPTTEDVEAAPNGFSWSGKFKEGHGTWTLFKNKGDSYTTNTSKYHTTP